MDVDKTLFAQVMEFTPWTSFSLIVARYSGDSGVRSDQRFGDRRGEVEAAMRIPEVEMLMCAIGIANCAAQQVADAEASNAKNIEVRCLS